MRTPQRPLSSPGPEAPAALGRLSLHPGTGGRPPPQQPRFSEPLPARWPATHCAHTEGGDHVPSTGSRNCSPLRSRVGSSPLSVGGMGLVGAVGDSLLGLPRGADPPEEPVVPS